ncbi:ribonuclease Z [Candidatus Pacearchaeota archaeon]|nr:MAG: ribonuclease Z [Candidatus Pacearchaeota archaeon]
MKLTVLGSGTGWIRLERNAPGYLLELNKFILLIDCGPCVTKQILKAGKKLDDISAIFISHFHPDHVSDLIPFFFATHYRLGYFRKEPIILYACEGFKEFYKGLKNAFGHWVEPPKGLLNIIELPKKENYSFMIGPAKAWSTPVKHNPESLALKIEYKNKKLVYSGDTGYCEELIKFSQGVDLLIVECSNSEKIYVEHHLSAQDIALIGKRSKVKKLMLTHFYPHSEDENLIEKIKKEFDGEVILAEDLLSLSLD